MDKPTFGSIIRNNLIALLVAVIVCGIMTKIASDVSLFLFGLFYLSQALFNLIMAFTHLGKGPEEVGAAPYFLSVLLVLIIGFGSCTGLFAYLNINGGPPH